MPTRLDQDLEMRLAELREQHLLRELRRVDSPQGPRIVMDGQRLLNFSSNDYLGMANHPALKEAAVRAIERFGVGAGASRLICGSLPPHYELEEALATFKGTEAALTFSSGYATALGTICALMGKNDVIILDRLVHACIVDAARQCGAKLRVFKHNDLDNLERVLKSSTTNPSAGPSASRILVVTESVFSMDGDHAPLREIVALKERYGAWLMVDEAHATGLYGKQGQGLASELGVTDRIEIQMGTLGKALGVSGGCVAGSRKLVDYLVNRARSFVFSTAPLPCAAATASEAIRLVQGGPGNALRRTLWARVTELSSTRRPPLSAFRSAILPVLVGDEAKAVELSARLRAHGCFVPAIRHPTVARGQARLRLTLTASHTRDDVAALTRALDVACNT